MFVGRARSLPQSGSSERCFICLGSSLASKYQTRLERSASDKNSSLLRKFVNYGRKKFYNIGPRWLGWSPVTVVLQLKLRMIPDAPTKYWRQPLGAGNDSLVNASTFNIIALRITTFSIMTLRIMTLSIITHSIITHSIMTLSIRTLGIMIFRITTLSIKTLSTDTQLNGIQHYDTQHYDTQHYDTQHNATRCLA